MKKPAIIASVMIAGLLMLGVLFLSTTRVCCVISDHRSTQGALFLLQSAVLLHVQEYGTLPEPSSDTSVLEILCGKNPRKVNFYSAAPDQVRDGQLLDYWGHAFLFQRTPDSVVIRSAGKDGIYNSKDDLTIEVYALKAT
jgi:hypothetical protein